MPPRSVTAIRARAHAGPPFGAPGARSLALRRGASHDDVSASVLDPVVEEFWFRRVVVGEPIEDDNDEADAWQVGPEVPAETVFSDYRRQIERADAIIAVTPLDAAPAWWPDFFGDFRLDDLHAIIVHVITETATHAGHLDTVRELIDGRTWLILTG